MSLLLGGGALVSFRLGRFSRTTSAIDLPELTGDVSSMIGRGVVTEGATTTDEEMVSRETAGVSAGNQSLREPQEPPESWIQMFWVHWNSGVVDGSFVASGDVEPLVEVGLQGRMNSVIPFKLGHLSAEKINSRRSVGIIFHRLPLLRSKVKSLWHIFRFQSLNFRTGSTVKWDDFKLAGFIEHDQSLQTMAFARTMGYMAPECLSTGKARRQSDVYSFGVVALQIACGRRPIEVLEHPNKVKLVEWVWEILATGVILEEVDEKLNGEFDQEQMERLMVVGLWCSHPDFNLRPSMDQAISMLNGETALSNLIPPR
ncbi:probable L-type lectin-domain containing receptor kinase I.2 [Zingiber officinale]|uniref:probable L-type lectin-domain containing receptor kinase I.2 n=1 Tax=Zingiber officinale TaxID=94328 RepID=UPI001C4B4664|nr:probable L-type lectin-domain containing receptor kinase I.2 [Zingiber officinale]